MGPAKVETPRSSSRIASRSETRPWDFSQALDLINTLSSPSPAPRKHEPLWPIVGKDNNAEANAEAKRAVSNGLGDFSTLWAFLGQASDLPPPAVPAVPLTAPPGKPSYISDGAIYRPPSAKSVKWRDEAGDGGELTDAAQDTESVEQKPLTKTQRKKLRRRQRAELAARQRTASDFESEADVPRPPARKASVHNIQLKQEHPKHSYNLRPRASHEKSPANGTHEASKAHHEASQRAEELEQLKEGGKAESKPPLAKLAKAGKHDLSKDKPTNVSGSEKNETGQELHAALQAGYQSRLPAHIAHITKPAYVEPTQQPLWLQPGFLTSQGQPSRSKPLVIREGVDRNLALRLKLIHDFGQDKKWLTSPVPMANHTRMSNGIHVFIDYSNIWIGFMELVKQLTGLTPNQRTPHKNLSFDSLVLLLERGRPVAKRVLAGSAPFLPAFDTARAIGYELNILDKVFKAKELTPRQRKFAGYPETGDSTGGSGSESATAYAPEKWVEQGVDEILHLKLLESIVDATDADVSTIVLATGDAAAAEYSPGFLAMVERALRKGWRVELASWSKGLSYMYRSRDFAERWQGRFSIVDLDDFAEFLLDT